MKKLIITLGDDNNQNYHRTIELCVPTRMHRILSDYDVDEMDEHDQMWDMMCDMIEENFRDIPRSWFIDKIQF